MPKLTSEQIAKERKKLERGLISQEEFDGSCTGQHLLSIADRKLSFNQMLQEMEYDDPNITLETFHTRLSASYAQLTEHDFWSDWYYQFMLEIRDDDEIREWSTISSFSGTKGYILVRNGQAIDYYITGIA